MAPAIRLTEQNGNTQMATATAKKAPKSAVVIKAPKLVSAWNEVCSTSAKSENEIVKAIENLSATMKLESRLTVAEQKKFIKGLEDGGKVSSFIKSSHAPALLTWSKLRTLHADFRARLREPNRNSARPNQRNQRRTRREDD
jgi:hypothetical protein